MKMARFGKMHFFTLVITAALNVGFVSSQTLRGTNDSEIFQRRDLSEFEGCRKSMSMNIPLYPRTNDNNAQANLAALEQVGSFADNSGVKKGKVGKRLGLGSKVNNPIQTSSSTASLTFCLDRIFLDLDYILNVGMVITDLDIECPHVQKPIHFLSSDMAIPIESTTETTVFSNGYIPSEVEVDNVDILRILADGDKCEFKVKAPQFDEGILYGMLTNDGFIHDDDDD